jgi:NAD(P)-dependent dehydrogenase (short-subunit alcohol dehydrogenase family)
MGDLMAGKAGLVTGGASGIGKACAIRFGEEGAYVAVADLESSREAGEAVAQTIRDSGGEADFVATDVARSDDNIRLVEHVVNAKGRIDYAHNNAGLGPHALLADTPDEDFDHCIAVNLRGTFLGMKHQIRAMVPQGGGAIVNTSSNAGLRAVHMLSAYTASKHGIVGLTKSGAVEYAEHGIRVNCVCPGAIMTPLMYNQPPDRQQEILAPQAMKRFGEPEEVAAAVVWLCSDQASFVNGVALPVDQASVAGW